METGGSRWSVGLFLWVKPGEASEEVRKGEKEPWKTWRTGLVRGLLVPWSGKGSRFGGLRDTEKVQGLKANEVEKRQLSVCVGLGVPPRTLGVFLHVAGLWAITSGGAT